MAGIADALHYPTDGGVPENSKHILGGGTELFCRLVRKSYQSKLICEQHAAVFLYNAVDDDHNQSLPANMKHT